MYGRIAAAQLQPGSAVHIRNGRVLSAVAAPRRRERALNVVIILQRKSNLLLVVQALHPPGSLASRLNRGQKQRDQDADNRNNDKEFDQRKRGVVRSGRAESALLEFHHKTYYFVCCFGNFKKAQASSIRDGATSLQTQSRERSR
jgi:hypothetical protein